MHLQDQAMECLAWAVERQQEAEEQLHQLDAQLRYCASCWWHGDPRELTSSDFCWWICWRHASNTETLKWKNSRRPCPR